MEENMDLEEPRAEQDIFDDLAALCVAPGFVHALSWMSLRDNYIMFDSAMDSEALADSYVSERTIRTEFSTLLGLLIRKPIDLSDPTPAEIQVRLDRAYTLLQELHHRAHEMLKGRSSSPSFPIRASRRATGAYFLWRRISI